MNSVASFKTIEPFGLPICLVSAPMRSFDEDTNFHHVALTRPVHRLAAEQHEARLRHREIEMRSPGRNTAAARP